MRTIAELQTFLGGLTVDGKVGPKTRAAVEAVLSQTEESQPSSPTVGEPSDPVDARSEKNISTLLGPVQELARQLIRGGARILSNGEVPKVTSGTRTFAEQDALFAQGNVTKARGGYSNHNFGLAFDVTVFDASGKPIWDGPQYQKLGAFGKSLGLSWGGDWKSIVDEPHFELRPKWAASMSESEMIAELRRRHSIGQKYL